MRNCAYIYASSKHATVFPQRNLDLRRWGLSLPWIVVYGFWIVGRAVHPSTCIQFKSNDISRTVTIWRVYRIFQGEGGDFVYTTIFYSPPPLEPVYLFKVYKLHTTIWNSKLYI